MSRNNCSILVDANSAVGLLTLLPAAIIVSAGIWVLQKTWEYSTSPSK